MPPEGQTAGYGDDVCGILLLVVDSTFCTIPTVKKSHGAAVFHSGRNLIVVKLLTIVAFVI